MRGTSGTTDCGAHCIAIPLLPRLGVALAIVIAGARAGQRWTVPLAAMLALPVLWLAGLSMMVAVVALAVRDRTAARTAAGYPTARGSAAPVATAGAPATPLAGAPAGPGSAAGLAVPTAAAALPGPTAASALPGPTTAAALPGPVAAAALAIPTVAPVGPSTAPA